ncbi:MAG: ketoacyl-ACP synthase III [Candidatus Galacturonibacter soehngenii]|nr:ketoacyl-ACP synthase III [Candidatus Galacturonibacter soehngenii]
MQRNIIMKATGICHPREVVSNQFFVDYYAKMDPKLGVQVEHLMAHLGRKNRFISKDKKETVLTMAEEAAKITLAKAKLSPLDLDGIIFSTDTPEYTSPSNAIMLRHALGAENAHIVYDLNANCVGMVVALDQASALMKSNHRIKRIMVVGSTMIHHYGLPTDPITYACMGDAAATAILEVQTDELEAGFLDSIYATNTMLYDYILMPECGLSNFYDSNVPQEKKKWKWTPFDTTEAESRCAKIIKQVANDNKLQMEDIKMVFMTQFSEAAINNVSSQLSFPRDKMKYVGDIYGYTGTSSPILAYTHAMEENEVSKGDYCIFCSVGSGLTASAVLYKES